MEIGSYEDHVHFMVQSVQMCSPKKIVNAVKSITGIEIFKLHPEVKTLLWGGKLWTSGYYVNIVGLYGNAKMIEKHVKSQGKEYKQIQRKQLTLF